jgi:hypothetical protein
MASRPQKSHRRLLASLARYYIGSHHHCSEWGSQHNTTGLKGVADRPMADFPRPLRNWQQRQQDITSEPQPNMWSSKSIGGLSEKKIHLDIFLVLAAEKGDVVRRLTNNSALYQTI